MSKVIKLSKRMRSLTEFDEIVKLSSQSKSFYKIANELNIPKKTVQDILKRIANNGLEFERAKFIAMDRERNENIRVCDVCKEEKPISAFGKRRTCKECYNRKWQRANMTIEAIERERTLERARYQADPESFRAAGRAFNRTLKGRFSNAKRIAKRRTLEWTLTIEEYEQLIQMNCFYCDGALGKVEVSVGLDRIDNNQGYSIDNVLPCCATCNRLRGDWLTVEETRIAIKAVLEHRKSLAISATTKSD